MVFHADYTDDMNIQPIGDSFIISCRRLVLTKQQIGSILAEGVIPTLFEKSIFGSKYI